MEQSRSGFAYPVQLDPEPDGGFTVSFPDFCTPEQPGGGGCSWGRNLDEALTQAADLLETIVANRLLDDQDVPLPSEARGRPLVAFEPLVAAKVELYRTMRGAGVAKAELARRLGVKPYDVEALFDTNHISRLDLIAAAFAALGRRLVVTSEAA